MTAKKPAPKAKAKTPKAAFKRGPMSQEMKDKISAGRRASPKVGISTPTAQMSHVASEYIRGIVESEGDSEGVRRYPTIAELARRHNIPENTLYTRSSTDNWTQQRVDFQRDLREREDKMLLEELAARRVRSQVGFATTGQRIQAQVDRRLRNTNVDEGGLVKLATALRSSQQVVEVAMGKPADGPTVNVDWTLFAVIPAPPTRAVIADLDAPGPEFGGVVTPERGR